MHPFPLSICLLSWILLFGYLAIYKTSNKIDLASIFLSVFHLFLYRSTILLVIWAFNLRIILDSLFFFIKLNQCHWRVLFLYNFLFIPNIIWFLCCASTSNFLYPLSSVNFDLPCVVLIAYFTHYPWSDNSLMWKLHPLG